MGTIDRKALCEIKNVSELRKKSSEEIKKAMVYANNELMNYVESTGISYYELSASIGYSTIKKLVFNCPIRFNAGYIKNLAYDVYHCSCHSIFFNEKTCVSKLPRFLSYLVEKIFTLPERDRQKVFKVTDDEYNSERKNKTLREDEPVKIDGKSMSEIELKSFRLLSERICEIISDEGVLAYNLFGNKLNANDKMRIQSAAAAQFSPKMSSFLYWVILSDNSLDYFIARDYTKYTNCRLYGSNEIIKDKDTIKFISKYLQLSESGKRLVEREVLTLQWTCDNVFLHLDQCKEICNDLGWTITIQQNGNIELKNSFNKGEPFVITTTSQDFFYDINATANSFDVDRYVVEQKLKDEASNKSIRELLIDGEIISEGLNLLASSLQNRSEGALL